MKRFLRANWIWIAAPVVLALVALLLLAIATHTDSLGDYVYFR